MAGEWSPIGRTRTFPRAQAAVDRLRFAIASCQHFEAGHYTAYQHMAEEDLDLVMHLGDYIYENPGNDKLVRKHVGGELMTVDDYRNRYAQYRSDAALRAVHALFPFLVVWDDHEVDNNYAGLHQEAGAPSNSSRSARGGYIVLQHIPRVGPRRVEGALLHSTAIHVRELRDLDARYPPVPHRSPAAITCSFPAPKRRSTRNMLGVAQKVVMNRLDRARQDGTRAQQIPMARLDRFAGPSSDSLWTNGTATSQPSRLLRFLGDRSHQIR